MANPSARATPLLEIAGLAFGHDRRVVGRGVALSLGAGEVLCLLGPNGGGKTTLLRTVLGLIPALGGTVRVEGEDICAWSAARRARALAYVPQSAAPTFPFPVRDIVLMGRAARLGTLETPGASDRARAEAALREIGIAHLSDRPFTAISGGERQMVLIARALVQEPALMVLDEPTASLDFANQERVLRLVAGLAGKGMAVIFSTHHPDQAFAVATKVAMLRDGALMHAGPVAETLTAEALTRLYGTRVSVAEIGGRKVCFADPAGEGAASIR